MKRLPVALWAAIVAAVVLAGCGAGAPSGRVTGSRTSPAAAAPSGRAGSPGSGAGLATASSPPGTQGLLQGKYQALAIAFPGGDIGLAAISGYAGQTGWPVGRPWARTSPQHKTAWRSYPRSRGGRTARACCSVAMAA